MSLTFAETPNGTPAALRADSQGRLDASWDYTHVTASGTVHTGPCVVAGFTPVDVTMTLEVTIRDGTGPGGQLVAHEELPEYHSGEFFEVGPPGGARLQNGLYVQLAGTGAVLIWWRRA